MFNLKAEIACVRKNLRQYFITHLDAFGQMDSKPLDALLPLLFSAIGSDKIMQTYFEMGLNALTSRDFLTQSHPTAQAYYYSILALNARYEGHMDEAMTYFMKSYDIAHQAEDNEVAAQALIGIGSCFYFKNQLEDAEHVLQQALRLNRLIESRAILGDIFNNFGMVQHNLGHHTSAFEAYETALKHYQQIPDYKEHINYWSLVGNIAIAYIDTGQVAKADEYIAYFDTLVEEETMLTILPGAFEEFSEFYAQKGDYQRAHQLMKKQLNAQINYQASINKQFVKPTDHIVDQISSLEALKFVNRQLISENTFLQQRMSKEIDTAEHEMEILYRVGVGIRQSEFEPYFQAVFDTDNRTITGYEVLARWVQEDRVIGPGVFIDIIEDTPLMIEVSEQIIRKSLAAFKRHLNDNKDSLALQLGFNIAPYQLVHQDLATFLESACAEYGISRRQITLEITERTFIENNQIAIDQLYALKESGFHLALDDFGTGYSSLGCISELPLDVVKIDMALVRGICDHEKAYHLFEGIVYMLRALGLKSVAEGVETEDQYALLKQLGCNRAQGFLLHRPSSEL